MTKLLIKRNWIMVVAILLLGLVCNFRCVRAEEDENLVSENEIVEAGNVTINTNGAPVTLYCNPQYINGTAVNPVVMPGTFPKSFQLQVSGASSVSYKAKNSYVNVSNTGLITIGDSISRSLNMYVESCSDVIEITADGQKINVSVNIMNYPLIYASKVMDDYIQEKIIKPNLKGMDLLRAICRFPANYDYNAKYVNWESMVVVGGGNCYASTGAVNEMCKRLNITAWVHNDSLNTASGSGHINSCVELDGKIYILDSGYVEKAPRNYQLSEMTEMFDYIEYGVDEPNGCTVWQYAGKDNVQTITVPSTSGAYNVIRIKAFTATGDGKNYKEIIIPDTIKYINNGTFNRFSELERFRITRNVKEIGINPFAGTKLNEYFSCDPANPYYTVENGILYNKNKTEILSVPAANGNSIPATVKKIGTQAFKDNKSVVSLTLPESVEEIGELAFWNCYSLRTLDLSKTKIKKIPNSLTASVCTLDALILPNTITESNPNAFSSGGLPKYIYGEKGSYAERMANELGVPFRAGTPDMYPDTSGNNSGSGTNPSSGTQKGNFASYQGYSFYAADNGEIYCYNKNGAKVINEFKCDGTYTYFFQANGTAMKNRLTYHPDGVHVIYFDANGHEVFSDFANVKQSIAGEAVDDYCFFDIYGYLYVDVVTYDKTGTVLYYANEYGVMPRGKWFQFSPYAKWAGNNTPDPQFAGKYGCAGYNAMLMTNAYTTDWEGRNCYMQANGTALYY